MNIKEILQLVERFDASKATRLQLKSGDTELLLESGPLQNVCTSTANPGTVSQSVNENTRNSGQTVTSENGNKGTVGGGKAAEKSKATEPGIEGIPVKAPLVGTFYCAPSPEDNPFVSVGQSVKKGDVIGIIEAMKLMNEITAPESGVVKSILAQNGNMVEYGEVLMMLE